MSGPNTLAWEYDGHRYVRNQSGAASVDTAGAAITADSVVVVFVEQIDTGRIDSAGQPVPDYTVTGSGEAVVFRNGLAWPSTWERDDTSKFFRFLRPNGQEIPMDPGRTWIHLTPLTGSVEWRYRPACLLSNTAAEIGGKRGSQRSWGEFAARRWRGVGGL